MSQFTRLHAVGLICLIIGVVTTTSVNGYTLQEHNGHFYALTAVKNNWLAAEAEANLIGGHLVAVNSLSEHEWLVQTFLPPIDLVSPPVFWIGLTDNEAYGGSESFGQPNPAVNGWVWTTGESVSFTNWNDATATGGPQEPNNYYEEDFAAMNWHYVIDSPTDHVDIKGTWNDFIPTGAGGLAVGPYYGIIELSVPEPASLLLCVLGIVATQLRRQRTAR